MSDLIRKSDALAEIHRIFNGYPNWVTDTIAALHAVTVGVKPLVWKETYEKVPKSAWASHTGFGRWFIVLEFLGMNHAVYRLHEIDYPTLDAAKAAAQADYEARILAALEPVEAPDLTDPVTVHANMLRGTIAKPTVEQIIHLYGREAFQPMTDAAVAKALEEAAALMEVAAENCRKQFTHPTKTKEQRDYQTGAIIHSNAAAAILALIQKGAADDRA